MPNMNWSQLTSMQLGRYAEYYAKMEFASYGFEVYTSEVDDHGVDFVAKLPNSNRFLEVQVKSVRDYKYTSIYKSKMQRLSEDRLICYLHFRDGSLPDIFVFPSSVWENPTPVFVKYEKTEQPENTEYGINISRKHYDLLKPFVADEFFKSF